MHSAAVTCVICCLKKPLLGRCNMHEHCSDSTHLFAMTVIRIQCDPTAVVPAVWWEGDSGPHLIKGQRWPLMWRTSCNWSAHTILVDIYVCVWQSLYCTILYCTVLYCTVLYCTVLHCTVLYCTVLYFTPRTVLYCNPLCLYVFSYAPGVCMPSLVLLYLCRTRLLWWSMLKDPIPPWYQTF